MPASQTAVQHQHGWKHDGMLLLVVLIWGVNFPVLKAAIAVMPLLVVNAFRFLVSVIVLGVLYAWRNRTNGRPFFEPMRLYGWRIAGLGFFGYVVYQFAFIFGLDFTTSGSAALIMASSPLWTAVLGYFHGTENLSGGAWLGLLVSLAGTIGVVVGSAEAVELAGTAFFGNVLMLAAAVCWGVYTAISKPLLDDVSPIGLSFFGLLVGLPFLVSAGVPGLDAVAWARVDLWVWLAIIFSGGLSTGIAFVVWNNAIKHVGSSQTAVFGNLVPFVALLGGVLVLGEPLLWVQIVGGLCIVGGLLLMRQSRRHPSLPPTN